MKNNRHAVKFKCDRCGREIAVPQTYAGRKGKCPTCKTVVTVPDRAATDAGAGDPAPESVDSGPKSPLHEALLLDVRPSTTSEPAPATEAEDAEADYERLRAMSGGRLPGMEEDVPQRRLPWIIDIFFYPFNKAGLTLLFMSVGIPLVLRTLTKLLFYSCGRFPPVFIIWVLFIFAHWLGLFLFVLYMNWYICECIRDSAEGGVRAADTIAMTPGLGELFVQVFRVIACALAVMAPALIYLLRTHNADQQFRVLYGLAGFLFPMALLAVVMFEGLRGLNPFLLIRSILKTPLQYSALVVFCYILCLLIPVAGYYLLKLWILGYTFLFLTFYQLLILAHLLGRFYWRNEEKLNWDA